jgi:pimeloyl-ACP methyl ester carboxylesterase
MVGPSIREGYIPVPGGRAWYRIDESKDGVPLFTLQGGPGTSSGYLEPLINLSDDRPVILYDNLGVDAPQTDPAYWDFGCCVEQVHQVHTALGLQKVHMLGYGWGALIALDYALAYPALLASLILDPLEPAGLLQHICWPGHASQEASRPGLPDMARLAEIRAPKLFIWEGEWQGDTCLAAVQLGWELHVLQHTVPRSYGEEYGQFTDVVRAFLHRVELGGQN